MGGRGLLGGGMRFVDFSLFLSSPLLPLFVYQTREDGSFFRVGWN